MDYYPSKTWTMWSFINKKGDLQNDRKIEKQP